MPQFLFFPYFGPNRRSDRRVVELRVDFDAESDKELLGRMADIPPLLSLSGILRDGDVFPGNPLPDEARAAFTSLLAQTAVLLQTRCGHRVEHSSVLSDADNDYRTALIEFEHCDVGMSAVKMAIGLFNGQLQTLSAPFRQFSEFAQQRRLPAETRALIKAASNRDIPVFRLEQEPYAAQLNLPHRVRQNGLLMLGHGSESRILDGTFCVSKSGEYLTALLRNPELRKALIADLGINGPAGTEQHCKGAGLYHLLVINRQLTAITQSFTGRQKIVKDVHPSVSDMAMTISERIGFLPLVIELMSTNLTDSLSETHGSVLDFDLAPDLERVFSGCDNRQALLETAAADIIDDLYPHPDVSRMPIVAVTGTNGKTTSCRMINHIMQTAGRKPGLVCTDGMYFNGKQISQSDAGSLIGHFKMLSSQSVDVAVLETHHRGIAVRGFAFDKCDVAVCLNVTEEHLKKGEIESVDEMSKVKRALLERASHAAVLNADDKYCLSMLEHITAERICLVSLSRTVDKLRELVHDKHCCYCVLENVEHKDWLVIYERNKRLALIRADQIPATFDGTAAFNTSNAMHAIMAAFLLGTGLDDICHAMRNFSSDFETTPGRMNVFDDLPFRVIIDFVHTPDGMKKIAEFTDRQNVAGRKLIAMAGTDARSERANILLAKAVAGHFDVYFCREYDPAQHNWVKPMAPLIRKTLIEEGVPEDNTRLAGYAREDIFKILDNCQPGDLLILVAGYYGIKVFPEYLREYAQQRYP